MAFNRVQFIAGTGATFAGINIVRAPAKAADFQYKMGMSAPLNDPRHVDAVMMWNDVRKETGGKLDVKLFPNSALGTDTAMIGQIRSGALDFLTISPGILSGVVPVAGIEGIPFAFKSLDVAWRAFDGALGAYVRSEIEAAGMVVMPKVLDNGFRQITNSTRPIKTVDDIAGLKLRTPVGKLWIDLFKHLGAIPTAINFADIYSALQTHIVDGQENPYGLIYTGHFYEVQKYLSVADYMWGGYWVIGNKTAWTALGPDIQKIVVKHMNVYAERQRRDNVLYNNSTADKLRRLGLTFNRMDVATFKPRVKDLYASWKSDFGGKAFDLLEQYTGKLT
ncbi:MAG: TRAP transporter substrate-binding protein [Candidatus Velthaea sp.]